MNKIVRAPVLFVLLLSACGQSAPPPPPASGAEQALCSAIKDAGPIVNCSVNSRDRSVAVVIDAGDDEKAREACVAFADKARQAAGALQGLRELKIYSPYRSDKELAACALGAAAPAY